MTAKTHKNPTLKEALKPGIRYVVLSGTRCHTLQAGDSIQLDGYGLKRFGGGWLSPGNWEKFRCPVSVHRHWYETEITRLREAANAYSQILEENP